MLYQSPVTCLTQGRELHLPGVSTHPTSHPGVVTALLHQSFGSPLSWIKSPGKKTQIKTASLKKNFFFFFKDW